MMFLVDTNIFLEILLRQDKEESCKEFLNNNIGNINITDFSLHSIVLILFRYDKEDIFQKFIEDVTRNTKLLSLPMEKYEELIGVKKRLKLDFDDSYQYSIAKYYGLKIVTLDKDFKSVEDLEILFL